MIKEIFQQLGTVPVEIEWLNRAARIGETVREVSFSILIDIPSRPVALLLFSDNILLNTSSSEHNRLAGQSDGSTAITS